MEWHTPSDEASGQIHSDSIAMSGKRSPHYVLREYGYRILLAQDRKQVNEQLPKADAAILHMPLHEVKDWGLRHAMHRKVPIMWWCSSEIALLSAEYCESELPLDGLLAPSMSEQEMHWALHLGAKQHMERQQWDVERRQLEGRLEERKWIDMAKGILCKLKSISEAEAYELLRKQAMNERKRMVDVAASIVKVHQLLQDQQ
ncbi:ANTAR domain-containing response regulator [Paenibacillus sp. 1011MAR3C5]|uniref:ANTAR domain-containing response regulator n=1 Tax=Paenibacillus sp. 1011MAR3C5 TaxID=1675787 RepID=UPI002175EB1B|nr:ANTAR domain-containing protein [Paenibacillus sp. 1011MAR3C5]